MRAILPIFALTLLGAALPADACCICCGDDAIPIKGTPHYGKLHGDLYLCVTEKDQLIAVDLKNMMTTELGSSKDRRWHDGDVADGRLLVAEKNRLLAINLKTGKTVAEMPLGDGTVWAFGFAGKDRVFIHRGQSLSIVEFPSNKVVHTISFGDREMGGIHGVWQKVGNKLYIAAPATTLAVIDLDAGKLLDRISVDARGGIASIHIEGSVAFCSGYPFAWGFRNDSIVSVDLETKQNRQVELRREGRSGVRFARGPFASFYLMTANRIDRVAPSGELCGSFTMAGTDRLLGVWRNRALVGAKDEIRFVDIKETPIAQK